MQSEAPAPPPGAFGGWHWYELPDSGATRLAALLFEVFAPGDPSCRADGYLRGIGLMQGDAEGPANEVRGYFWERGRWWRYPLHAHAPGAPAESPRLATARAIDALTARARGMAGGTDE